MPKPKSFIKQSRAKKKPEQVLEDADDYLAAGVDHEEAAGKWRAGDAAKSMRFFNRAIDVYEEGLRIYPQSLDLAYNKARVQYEIATHPILIRQLQAPVLEVLETTLESHRYALKLDSQNPDSLFNTSQVLTSLAEEFEKDDRASEAEAISLLEEALELQDKCFVIQELRFEESKQQEQAAAELLRENASSDDMLDTTEGDSHTSSEAERNADQWAMVVEPVTTGTLVDTIVAQLGTMTALCRILSTSESAKAAASLNWIEGFSSKLLQAKLPLYIGPTSERLQEIALARANFMSSLFEAGYRKGRVDAMAYKRERDAAFSTPELDIENNSSALIANAYSLLQFHTILAEGSTAAPESNGLSRWNILALANSNLMKASKLSGIAAEDVPQTHTLRGDCALLQCQLGKPPVNFEPATRSTSQLLKNAEVFYRNAAILSQDSEDKTIANFRMNVVWGMQKNEVARAVASAGSGKDEKWKQSQLEDMIEEGLLSRDLLST